MARKITPVLETLPVLLHKAALRTITAMEEAAAEMGLSTRALLVLSEACTAHAGSQRELSERVHLDQTLLLGVLDELEQHALIERVRNPDDRRQHRVHVTAAGTAVLHQVAESLVAIEKASVPNLTAGERAELTRLLRKSVLGP